MAEPTLEQQRQWLAAMKRDGRQYFTWIDNNARSLPPEARQHAREASDYFEMAFLAAGKALEALPEPEEDDGGGG